MGTVERIVTTTKFILYDFVYGSNIIVERLNLKEKENEMLVSYASGFFKTYREIEQYHSPNPIVLLFVIYMIMFS